MYHKPTLLAYIFALRSKSEVVQKANSVGIRGGMADSVAEAIRCRLSTEAPTNSLSFVSDIAAPSL